MYLIRERKCIDCGATYTPTGCRQKRCPACRKKKMSLYHREHYKRNRSRIRADAKVWHQKNREAILERHRRRYYEIMADPIAKARYEQRKHAEYLARKKMLIIMGEKTN